MAKRPPIRNADDPIKVAPPAPDELRPAGQVLWDLTARSLVKAGRLTFGDLVGLRTMCQTESIKDEAYQSLCELGSTMQITTTHGTTRVVPNPAAAVFAKADTSLRQWYQAFGLTPAGRQALHGEGYAPQTKEWPAWWGPLLEVTKTRYIAYYGEVKVKAAKRMLPPPDVAADIEANREDA